MNRLAKNSKAPTEDNQVKPVFRGKILVGTFDFQSNANS